MTRRNTAEVKIFYEGVCMSCWDFSVSTVRLVLQFLTISILSHTLFVSVFSLCENTQRGNRRGKVFDVLDA